MTFRRGLLALLALVLVLVAAVLWRSRSRPDAPAPVASAPSVQAPAPAPAEPAEAVEEEPAGLPEAVERYLAATVYPPTSGALGPGATDLLQPNRRYERMMRVPGTPGADPPPAFLWTADRFHYTSDEVVRARFEARLGGVPAQVALDASAQPEGRAGAEGHAIPLLFRPRDEALIAELDLARELPEHHGPVALTARYSIAGMDPQEETIRIFVTPAARVPARFTGSFRDRVRDGGLEIEVGIEVDEPGFYRIDANLYDADGEPLAWAVHKGELRTRDGVVSLRFFGKVLRDAGRPGPYELGELRGYLFRDGQFPDRLHLRPYSQRHRTRSYALAEFSAEEWDGEHRRRMVELLLEDEARGIALEAPPLAVAGEGGGAGPDRADAGSRPQGATVPANSAPER